LISRRKENMTEHEMRKLKIGDVVSFLWDDGTRSCPGMVTGFGFSSVSFTWDDGQNGWVDFRDGEHLRRKE